MNHHFFFAALLYLSFVIYGSLVPLDFNDMPFNEALSQFKNIRYLNLGIESRADWVANILLYIPLAFLCSATSGGIRHPVIRIFLLLIISGFCLSAAVAIEFTQLFFPPRTVSINDLIAEAIGTVIGISVWQFFGQYLIKLYRQISLGSLLSAKAAIIFYLLIYLSLSFFPFDFITSFSELELKLASDRVDLLISSDSYSEDVLRSAVKLLVEILVLLPLGALFCLLPYISHKLILAILIGFFLGFFIEGVQIFLVSGVAQGISVLTRMIGMGLGAGFFIWVSKQRFSAWAKFLKHIVLLSILPYILLVMTINGWLRGEWLNQAQALEKLADTHFLPLYYFYYTSEGVALVSLLSNVGMYLPVGLLFWAGSLNSSYKKKLPGLTVGLCAAGFAFIIETGKLFLVEKHADPTDILIAFAAAVGSYVFMNHVIQWLSQDKAVDAVPMKDSKTEVISDSKKDKNLYTAYLTGTHEINKKTCWVSLILVVIIGWLLLNYPLQSIWLTGFLILYGFILFRFPQSWLIVVPALLPVMDFAPWTGRFFIDEFDMVVLTTVAFYFWQKPKQPVSDIYSATTVLLLVFLSIFYIISLLRGLLPLQPIDVNSFSNYYSNYNSLRIGKGVVWALLLLPFLKQTFQDYNRAMNYFGYGILLGLTGVTGFSIIERLVFPGLLDFSTDYRINALFSTMHTGGGHIESYLALTLPFIVLLFRSSPLTIFYGTVLFIAGLYVLLVTFSRGGYIGLAVGFIVLMSSLLVCFRSKLDNVWKPLSLVVLLAAIIPVIAIPVFQGTLIQHRFSIVDQDSDIRMDHWRDAMVMMDNNISTKLLGMGLGSYPRTYFWLNTENVVPATYKVETEQGNNYLRLRGGDSLYIGQYVNVMPHTQYRLLVDLRSGQNDAILSIPLCEKSLQYSLRCSLTTEKIKSSEGNGWEHVERVIDSSDVGSKLMDIAGGILKRPVQLALYNGNGVEKIVDIDNISLIDLSGRNLLVNGDFSKGTDFWFFSTEKHHPWHVLNVWVHVLFDQGWLGVIALMLLLIKAVYNLCRHPGDFGIFTPILLASISGFMVVGFVDSPFDAPRLTLLFFLIVFICLIAQRKALKLQETI